MALSDGRDKPEKMRRTEGLMRRVRVVLWRVRWRVVVAVLERAIGGVGLLLLSSRCWF